MLTDRIQTLFDEPAERNPNNRQRFSGNCAIEKQAGRHVDG